MSRWRRQQRKRARRLFVSRALSSALDLEVERMLETAKASVLESLTRHLKFPEMGLVDRDRVAAALAAAIPHPRSETTVKVTPGPGGRSLKVDVTVHNPSAPLAAQLLAAGGKWV